MTERELAKNIVRPVAVFRIRIKVVQEPRKRHSHRTNRLVTRKKPPENRRLLSSWLRAFTRAGRSAPLRPFDREPRRTRPAALR